MTEYRFAMEQFHVINLGTSRFLLQHKPGNWGVDIVHTELEE